MSKPPLSHFSPRFANSPWADAEGYISYFYDPFRAEVSRKRRGKWQWGRCRGLYSRRVETSLNRNLETEAAHVYRAILEVRELDADERLTWAQFLLSQVVRTPTFMQYEDAIRSELRSNSPSPHDRVGCKECGDLAYVTGRDWCLLLAHRDDFFVRTDNPVLLTGFVERPESCLFYPLNPRVCFAACSMPSEWDPERAGPVVGTPFYGVELEKGEAHFINFHFARAAQASLILSPPDDGFIASTIFTEMIGQYPQPPFLLHIPEREELPAAYDSVRKLMSSVDGVEYPSWLPFELEPFSPARSEDGEAA